MCILDNKNTTSITEIDRAMKKYKEKVIYCNKFKIDQELIQNKRELLEKIAESNKMIKNSQYARSKAKCNQ